MSCKIIDREDGEVFFEGSLKEAKDWWWDQLNSESDVGGYQMKIKNSYVAVFGSGEGNPNFYGEWDWSHFRNVNIKDSFKNFAKEAECINKREFDLNDDLIEEILFLKEEDFDELIEKYNNAYEVAELDGDDCDDPGFWFESESRKLAIKIIRRA